MKRKPSFPLFFIGPALIYLLALILFPLAFSLVVSFYRLDLAAGAVWEFVGSANYAALLDDDTFQISLLRTGLFVVSAVSLELTAGLILALLLNREIRGKRIFRVVFLFPVMIGSLVAGFIWRLLYHSNGPPSYFAFLVGVGQIAWLGSTTIAPVSIILTDVWQWTPFMMLVLLAGLQTIPHETYEAAVVDGASRRQILRHITIPMLVPVIVVAVLIRAIDAFKIFDIIYILTSGGPGTSTYVVSLYAYLVGFKSLNVGYAAAMSYVLNFIVVGVSTIYIRTLRRKER